MKMKLSMNQKVILLSAIFSALISSIFGLVGVILNSNMVNQLNIIQQQTETVKKRADLLKQFSKLVNLSSRAEELIRVRSAYSEYLLLEKNEKLADVLSVLPYTSELANLNAEYLSTRQIISWSFCDKTRQTISEIPRAQNWFEVDIKYHQNVLKSMNDEIYCFKKIDLNGEEIKE